jgi:hypothetical protein
MQLPITTGGAPPPALPPSFLAMLCKGLLPSLPELPAVFRDAALDGGRLGRPLLGFSMRSALLWACLCSGAFIVAALAISFSGIRSGPFIAQNKGWEHFEAPVPRCACWGCPLPFLGYYQAPGSTFQGASAGLRGRPPGPYCRPSPLVSSPLVIKPLSPLPRNRQKW